MTAAATQQRDPEPADVGAVRNHLARLLREMREAEQAAQQARARAQAASDRLRRMQEARSRG